MNKYLNSNLGRLRVLGFLEGTSLLILVFIAVPIKYLWHNPILVKWVGQIHGILFILFVFNTLRVSIERNWRFRAITWKLIIASFFPFGTFYTDRKILAKMHQNTKNSSPHQPIE